MLRPKTLMTFFTLLIVLYTVRILDSQTPSKTVKIPDATRVRLSLQDSLTSASSKIDDLVHFEVLEDVKVGEVAVIPRGSIASGHVVEVEPKKSLGRSGKLNFTVDYVKAPDGSNVRLRASSTRKAEETSGSVLLAPFSLILGGKDVNIPKGTQFNAYVDGDREIAWEEPTHTPNSSPVTQASPPPTAEEPSTVVVKSTPEGADITVDGRYVGSTPSTLRLPPGEHTVVVEKQGYRQWQRTVSVNAGGIITINAGLETQ